MSSPGSGEVRARSVLSCYFVAGVGAAAGVGAVLNRAKPPASFINYVLVLLPGPCYRCKQCSKSLMPGGPTLEWPGT